MTFLETLYGGQYYEIYQRGGDTSKGRINGNIFLAVLVMLLFMDIILISIAFNASFPDMLGSVLKNWFGEMSGRSIGKLLAVVFIGACYFVLTKTIGTEKKYSRLVEKFMQYPEAEKNKAKWKALIPFGLLLVVLIAGIIMINR